MTVLTCLTVEVTEPELQRSQAEREQSNMLAAGLAFPSLTCVVAGAFTSAGP